MRELRFAFTANDSMALFTFGLYVSKIFVFIVIFGINKLSFPKTTYKNVILGYGNLIQFKYTIDIFDMKT